MKTVATTSIIRRPKDGADGNGVKKADMQSVPSFTWMMWQGLGDGTVTYTWQGVKNAKDYKVGDTIVVVGYVTDKDSQVNYYGTVTAVGDGTVTSKGYNVIVGGDDGESALYIVATPETDGYPADVNGIALKYTTHMVELRLYYGETALEDYEVEVCSVDDAHWYTVETLKQMGGDVYVTAINKNGAVCTVWYTVGEAKYADDNAYIQVRMTSAKYGQRVKQVNCFAQKRGETGERGAVLRGPQAWEDVAVGYAFQAGGDDEEYKDVVVYKGNYYSCLTSHQKTAGNYPLSTTDTNGNLWKLADKMEIVATKILLSEYALVKNLGVEAIEMKDKAGNVVFKAKDGAVMCKTGTFENVEIKMTGDDNAVYGAFGGGDYPLWFGGKNADEAVFKVSKEGRAQMSTYGYSISNAPDIDGYPTCLEVPVWLRAHDSENEQLAAAQYLTMESSIYVITPGIDFANKGDGHTPDNLIWCIPPAEDIGKFSIEIYIKQPNAFASEEGAPKLFICQGTLTGVPTGTMNGVYTSKNYNCSIDVHSSADGSSPAAYKIYDDALTENAIWKKYFPSESSFQLGLGYGYMELKLWEDTSTVNRFKYLPRYIRLLSDGKNWHLVEYRYS